MKTKTLLELITLTSSLYVFIKDSHLIDRFNEISAKGKEGINKMASESQLDADGNEMEFMDKIIHKTGQLKEEIEEKIAELVAEFYKKVNIAHLDEIEALKEKLEKSDELIALLEARVNHLEANN